MEDKYGKKLRVGSHVRMIRVGDTRKGYLMDTSKHGEMVYIWFSRDTANEKHWPQSFVLDEG